MKSITTELVDTGRKQDTRGRKITPPQEREALVLAYEESGLTQRAFAEREGIKHCTFTSWLQKRRGGVASRREKPRPVRFEELSLGLAPNTGSLEVVLADGLVIRGPRVGEMIELVRALRN